MRNRFHRGADPWGRDSFEIPANAVLGASDTGTSSDSPCNSHDVRAELKRFREVLRGAGIGSRWGITTSGNVFMTKLWVMVAPDDWARAISIADAWLRQHDAKLQYCHDARS